ncbi:hypothetical protein QOZ80_2AG0122210 [Eleusine coracana subsp. coracana]|nr:hypothetical protein QOZ80_2AG0122210 [Eleusine coracana subsp. coracana]
MLARQAWRLMLHPETLCGRVLKAKYFRHGRLLGCREVDGMSYSWRSILMGLDLVKEGIIWRVGDGLNINIWTDPWLPKGTTRRPVTPRGASLLTRVHELMDSVQGGWDEQLVQDTFWPVDAEAIMSIPIGENVADWPAWHYDWKGKFSVKSAYKLAVQNHDRERGRDASASGDAGPNVQEFQWHKIWQMTCPNKVKMLAVRRNLRRRKVRSGTLCPVCRRLDEDCGHLFFNCKQDKAVWRALNIEEIRIGLVGCSSGRAILQRICELRPEEQMKTVVLLWRWWSAKANAGERMLGCQEVCSSVLYHSTEFEKLEKQAKDTSTLARPRWQPPANNIYKINVDASFHESTRRGGWGYVARDSAGEVMDIGAGNINRVASALQAEAMAAMKGLQRAAEIGMNRIIIEMDAANLGAALRSDARDRSSEGGLIENIKEFISRSFDVCNIAVCPRLCNSVAHCLAAHGANALPASGQVFWCQAPSFVMNLVSGDFPGAMGY